MAPATPDQIRVRAYELWLAAGCPDGRDVEFWTAAEKELNSPSRVWRWPMPPIIKREAVPHVSEGTITYTATMDEYA